MALPQFLAQVMGPLRSTMSTCTAALGSPTARPSQFVHLTLNHLETIDLTFDLTGTPLRLYSGSYGYVFLKSVRERTTAPNSQCLAFRTPNGGKTGTERGVGVATGLPSIPTPPCSQKWAASLLSRPG